MKEETLNNQNDIRNTENKCEIIENKHRWKHELKLGTMEKKDEKAQNKIIKMNKENREGWKIHNNNRTEQQKEQFFFFIIYIDKDKSHLIIKSRSSDTKWCGTSGRDRLKIRPKEGYWRHTQDLDEKVSDKPCRMIATSYLDKIRLVL